MKYLGLVILIAALAAVGQNRADDSRNLDNPDRTFGTPTRAQCRTNVKLWAAELNNKRISLHEMTARSAFLDKCTADTEDYLNGMYRSLMGEYKVRYQRRVEQFFSRHPEIQKQFEAEDASEAAIREW